MVRFLLHNQLHNVENVAPWTSVLDYLRTTLALVGTKEGCAAGDCGACTVVVGELVDDNIHYKAINACITPVASLHGKQLITVENLQHNQELHPVQTAMVECHGSQCGFCTPGIVMSLFAWWQNLEATPELDSRHGVETALSGNLCRCTGYQPIFRAAEQAKNEPFQDHFKQQKNQFIEQLKALKQEPPGELSLGKVHFFAPASAKQLSELKQKYAGAKLVAGATDLGLEFTQQLKDQTVLIYTGNVKECLKLDSTDDELTIGAALTYSQIEPLLAANFPAFASLLTRLGSLQIRNQGTLGGNIANASPIGDTPPVLLALDAKLELASVAATRDTSINGFFTGYRQTLLADDESITAVKIPKLKSDETLKVYKISKRFDDDISAVCLALWLKHDGKQILDARIGCGGMAAIPARASHAEQALKGQPLTELTFEAAGNALSRDFTPLDDVRATKEYRLAVAAKLLLRAYYELNTQTPVNLFSNYQSGSIAGGFYHA